MMIFKLGSEIQINHSNNFNDGYDSDEVFISKRKGPTVNVKKTFQ